MPVAGLPAAVEVLLSSLLASDELSSWKVAGESNAVVVVLRFMPNDGRQPLFTSNARRGHWRRKPPAQLRRDQLRAQKHRGLGEQKPVSIIEGNNFEIPANAVFDIPSDAARTSRASMSSPSPPLALTFDPLSSPTHSVDEVSTMPEPVCTVHADSHTNGVTLSAVNVSEEQQPQGREGDEDWLKKITDRLGQAIAEARRCTQSLKNTSTYDNADPAEDYGEDLPRVESTTAPIAAPASKDSSSKISESAHQTVDCSTAVTPVTTLPLRGNRQQTASRQHSRSNASCDTGSTGRATRSRPLKNNAPNAQVPQK